MGEGQDAPLWPGEQRLVEALKAGVQCALGDDVPAAAAARPEPGEPVEVYDLRGAFVRALALGQVSGVAPHPQGLRVKGARIWDPLDFTGCLIVTPLSFAKCWFEKPVVFLHARANILAFEGGEMPGFHGDRLETRGSLYLRSGLRSRATISLVSARIGGDLRLKEARLAYGDGLAGVAESQVGGRRERLQDYRAALTLHKARVGGTLDLRRMVIEDGVLDLNLCELSTLKLWREDIRDEFAPEAEGRRRSDLLILDGCVYEHLPVGLASEPDLLERMLGMQLNEHLGQAIRRPGENADRYEIRNRFRPQPFEQLAAVLRATGYEDEAAQIGMLKQRLRRRGGMVRGASRPLHWLYGALAGYGYRPMWAVGWLAALLLTSGGAFQAAYESGAFAPRGPDGAIAADWAAGPGADVSAQLEAYRIAHPEQPAFIGPLYAFDTIYSLDGAMPLMDAGQASAWAPNAQPNGASGGWPADLARIYEPVHTLIGWALSFLALAGFAGLVRSRG